MRRDRQGNLPCFFVFGALLALMPGINCAQAEGIWIDAPTPPVSSMNAVAFMDRANAWAVGDQGNIIRYKFGTWNIFPSATANNLYAVSILNENDAWAVGAEGTIMHWDGDRWAVHPASGVATNKDLLAVAFLNENNGWAAGGGTTVFGGSDQPGVVLHYDGTSWTLEQNLSCTVTGIAAVASDYIWFCGYNRTLTLFDGALFTAGPDIVGDGKAWHAISFPYRRLGWVAGDDGKIGRFSPAKYPAKLWGTYFVDSNGATIPPTKGYTTAAANLFGLCVLPDPEWGYAVGEGGVRLRLDDDLLFRGEATGGASLNGIDLPNHEEGAAVGAFQLTGPRAAMLRTRTTQSGFAGTRAYPNPFEPLKGGMLTFDRLPADLSALDIFTMEGDQVASIGSGILHMPWWGVAYWDGKAGGKPAATGAYIARLTAPGAKNKTITFLLVKR